MSKHTYKTRHLAEAAALIVMGLKFIRMEREGAICWFAFDDNAKCSSVSNDFFFGSLLVNAREYHDAMSLLKNRVYSK